MKTQHTKAPWEIDIESNGQAWIIGGSTIIAQISQGELPNGDIELTKEEEANAKLIAVAPELLELAYEMRIVMGHLTGRMGEQMEIEVNSKIDSAIKKATS